MYFKLIVEVCEACGNSIIESSLAEECDDGDWTDGDGCNEDC